MKLAAVIAVIGITAAHAAAVAEAEPRRFPGNNWLTSCGVPGNSCARDAQPEADARKARNWLTSCGVPGNSCARDANAEPRRFPGWNWMTSCGVPGNSCAKAKRAALAVADALAEAEPRKARNWLTSCGVPGNSCAKARRSLEEVGSATEDVLDKVLAIDEDDEAIAKRDKLIHSHFPGSANSKTFASEDDYASENFKRGVELIKEDYPEFHKAECFQKGGECDIISKAHAAFHAAVKREDETRQRLNVARDASPDARRFPGWNWLTSCGVPGNSCARDAADSEQEKLAGNKDYFKAEDECYGPDGDCTAAEKYLADLESKLNEANEAVHTQA